MYKYLLFGFKTKYNEQINPLSGGTFRHCTGIQYFSDRTPLLGVSYDSGYPIVIEGEIYGPGIEYLNYFLHDAGLYLSKQDARQIYTNLESRKDLPKIYEQLQEYGSFCIYHFNVLPPRINHELCTSF